MRAMEDPHDVEVEVMSVEDSAAVKLTDGSASAQNNVVDAAQELQINRYQGDRDASVVQYREAASFFGALVKEREASPPAGQSTGIDRTIKEKVQKMSFLQSELEYVVSSGLASEARQKWLDDKHDLERHKRQCKHDMADLQAWQRQTTEAFEQLAVRTAGSSAEKSSALTVATQWDTSMILSTTSLRSQIAMLAKHVDLSERQMRIDSEDEALMKTALELYQQERASRDRRNEILQQQQELLTELQRLAEDKSCFNGHATFRSDGFTEGLSY